MKKNTLITLLVIVIAMTLTVLFFIRVVLPQTESFNSLEHRIFEDISELDILNEYVVDSAEDSKLNIEPIESFSHTINWNGSQFNVYAYVFSSIDDSRAYFKNVLHRDSNYDYDFYLANELLNGSQYLAYNNCCVLRVTSNDFNNFVDFISYINSYLTIEFHEHPAFAALNDTQS